jgi:1-acyl-sn-glycerol-3-phosphate acyltransferase
MNLFVLWFVKITGYVISLFYKPRKVYYASKAAKKRFLKGSKIVVSNHCAVMDVPLIMFLYFFNNFYFWASEIMYQQNKFNLWFLKSLGAIKVDRVSYDFSFINYTRDLVRKNKKIIVFPESRIHVEGDPLVNDFKSSYAYIAFEENVNIIPLYIQPNFKSRKKGYIMVGEEIVTSDYTDLTLIEFNELVKNKVNDLGELLIEKQKNK